MDFSIACHKGKHSERVSKYFSFDKIDAFYSSEVLFSFYGNSWFSVLIENKGNAFFHVFIPEQIPNSQFYDVDAFVGYYGPISNTSDSGFLEKALDIYVQSVQNLNLIAEVIRFNPIQNNNSLFMKSSVLQVVPAKNIVIVECKINENEQLLEFHSKCRSSVKRGMRNCEFRELSKEFEWLEFKSFYFQSLQRIGAHSKWYYSDQFFASAQASSFFKLFGVFHADHLVSATLMIDHPFAAYYLIAANNVQPVQGANEYMVFMLTRYLAIKKIKYLILGGGNTNSEDDPLMRFKRKFSTNTIPFYLGKLKHNKSMYDKLCTEAINKKPELENNNFFLKYRL